jgi:FkbM family methyltransferase
MLRTKILTISGKTWPALAWLRRVAEPQGVKVRKTPAGIELSNGKAALVISFKHAWFGKTIIRNFHAFAMAQSGSVVNGVRTVDYATDLANFQLVRKCLKFGVTIDNRGDEVWLHKDQRAMILAKRHFIYSYDMAERFELYFTPLVPQMREGLQVLDYSHPGKVQTYKSGLQFAMASFPEEEEAIEEYFRWYRPKSGDLVFDMGAHCGVSTYHLSKLVGPEGRVIAFEPDPVNFELLKSNIERHGLTNVTAENTAISGTAGELAFNSEGTIGSALLSLLQRDSVGSIVTVKAVTFADAFGQWGVPAFCKIDIEGAEVDVIAKSSDALKKHRINLAIDTNHPKPDGEMTNREVESMLQDFGYEVHSEARPLLTTWARQR